MTSPIHRYEGRISIEPNSGCWLWIGATSSQGYGSIRVKGKARMAHRVIFELMRRKIPRKKDLDHLCRTRCCVNPDHLEPVTKSENNRRSTCWHVLVSRRSMILSEGLTR